MAGGLVPIDLKHVATEVRGLFVMARYLYRELSQESPIDWEIEDHRTGIADTIRHLRIAFNAPDGFDSLLAPLERRGECKLVLAFLETFFVVEQFEDTFLKTTAYAARFSWETEGAEPRHTPNKFEEQMIDLEDILSAFDGVQWTFETLDGPTRFPRSAEVLNARMNKTNSKAPVAESSAEVQQQMPMPDRTAFVAAMKASSPRYRRLLLYLLDSGIVERNDVIRDFYQGKVTAEHVASEMRQLNEELNAARACGAGFLKGVRVDIASGGIYELVHPFEKPGQKPGQKP